MLNIVLIISFNSLKSVSAFLFSTFNISNLRVMKTLGILTFMVLFNINTNGFSQDTLYTKEGNTINGKVTEVTPDQIKYKKASNPDGPSYVINRSEVVLIHYKNGSKDVFQNSQNGSGYNTASNNNSNQNNNSNADPVYVNTRPNVNVVVGGAPYLALGGGWWGGWGWGGYYGRPYYGGYWHRNYYGGYHHGYYGGHYGGHYGGGHYGHHR